ncbi:MAG: dTMP kinase [Chloroflexi bacterium]|nr:dTMP kinase [Chloroflexota bacterium]
MFITFEGSEGSGKSTHAARLEARLREARVPVLLVREPGSTELGQYLRDWLKREKATVPLAELFLFEAARAQLVADVIRPALKSGKTVVSDRFTDSTLAYQGYGRGLDIRLIRQLNEAATGGLVPDVTVLLDVPVDVGLQRAAKRIDDADARKFEELPAEFHRKMAAGFRSLAGQDSGRWLVVDSTRDQDAVADEIWRHVSARLNV